ncbi:MAG: NAD-dependent epimerase/dehydratase family protein [Bryobacteraceae bacterium]
MLALVTGATGFVGSHLAERLLGEGWQVRCLVRRTSSLRWLPPGVETVYGDLAGGEGLREAVRDADTVFHVAGVTKARRTAEYYEGNVRATANLLEAAAGVPRLVHVSSLAAAGPGADLSEDAPARPVSAYGRSKLEAEQLVRGRAVIIRPPVVFGPRDTDVLHIFRAVSRGRMVRIGRGDSRFSFIYVKDLAEALASAARSAAPGTYFAAHPRAVSWGDFANAIGAELRVKVRTLAAPAWAAYAAGFCAELWSRVAARPLIISRDKIREAVHPYWTCNPGRARAAFGFEARTALAQAVAETVAWYRENGWLK